MPARCKRIAIPAAAVALCAAAVPVFAHPAHLAADRQAAPQAIQAAPVRDISLEQAIAAARMTARPATYRVQTGDTLSAIAGRYYQRPADWTVIYWANRIRWADEITAGQVLTVPAEPASIPAAPGQLEPPAPRPAVVLAAYSPAPVRAVAVQTPVHTQAATAGYQGAYPGGSFGACVVERESGGNAQVMNASGHWGLYQFSASTWQEYGGSAASFGDADVAEQEQVFANALARGGESNWSSYDGC
jgi:Transglycosylase-like domain/LysM domain